MKIDISLPDDEDRDGPFLVELEDLLTHRVIVTVGGQELLNADVRSMFLRGVVHQAPVTRLDLVAGLEPAPKLSAPLARVTVRPSREIDEHGQPICGSCKNTTNSHYAKHLQLICWHCGEPFGPPRK